jgi:hypothetical protein
MTGEGPNPLDQMSVPPPQPIGNSIAAGCSSNATDQERPSIERAARDESSSRDHDGRAGKQQAYECKRLPKRDREHDRSSPDCISADKGDNFVDHLTYIVCAFAVRQLDWDIA